MPTTSPPASATSRWWRSGWGPTKGPARSGPMTAPASAMRASVSTGCGERISTGSSVSPAARRIARRSVGRGLGSVRAGPDLLVQLLELVGREVTRLADGDDLPLVGLDLGHRGGDFVGDLGRDRHGPVLVRVEEIARLHPQAADLH